MPDRVEQISTFSGHDRRQQDEAVRQNPSPVAPGKVPVLRLVLEACAATMHQPMRWEHAQEACAGGMRRHHAMEACDRSMRWKHATTLPSGTALA